MAALLTHEQALVGGDSKKTYLGGFSEGAQLTSYIQLAKLNYAVIDPSQEKWGGKKGRKVDTPLSPVPASTQTATHPHARWSVRAQLAVSAANER